MTQGELKRLVERFDATGQPSFESTLTSLEAMTGGEASRSIYRHIIKLLFLFMFVILGGVNYSFYNTQLAAGYLFLVCLCLVSLAGARYLRPEAVERLDYVFCLLVCSAGFMFFVSSPAGDHTFLWLFMVPPVAIVFAGQRIGGIFLAVYCLAVALVCSPVCGQLIDSGYNAQFRVKLPVVLAVCSLMCWLFEKRQFEINARIKQLIACTAQVAMFDCLTGLYNRYSFSELLNKELSRCARNNAQMVVIMSDLDNFKDINDTYGHNCGDAVLADFARLCSNQMRAKDYVCRWGGEEFMLLLTDTDLEEGLVIAERLRKKAADLVIQYNGLPALKTTASFGVQLYDFQISIEDNIAAADKAMYIAKAAGKNKVQCAE